MAGGGRTMPEFQHLYFDIDVSPGTIRDRLLEWGCLVLRNAVDTANFNNFYETTCKLFEEDKTEYSPGSITRHRGVCNGQFLSQVAIGDKQAITKLLATPKLAAHLKAILGEEPALHPLYN